MFGIFSLKAERLVETVFFRPVSDASPDDSAAGQAALLSMPALCRFKRVSPARTLSDALAQAGEWLAAMAQLGRVRDERDALQADREASQEALSVVAEMLCDAVEGLSRQQHEIAGWYSKIAGSLSGMASFSADYRAPQGPCGADETHPPSFKRPRPF